MSFSFLAPKWGLKRRVVYDQNEKEMFKKNHKSEKNAQKASQGSWGLVTEKVSHQGNHPSCTKTLFQFLESKCCIEPLVQKCF